MISYDVVDYWDNAPDIARGNYRLCRLMIDQKYQKKGFGREAIALGLNFNKVACKLYHSFDFTETGDMEGNEIIAILEH